MRKLFKFKELIAIAITLSSSIFFFKIESLQKFGIRIDDVPLYSALLNIIILIIGIIVFSTLHDEFYLIKRKHGKYDRQGMSDIEKISNILKISLEDTTYFVERTSAVVGQLVRNFSLFLWPLIIFYLINIIKDHLGLEAHKDFKTAHSILDLQLNSREIFNVYGYLVLSALANLFNLISAIGLLVCFSVLYQKTMDAENKSTLHFGAYQFLVALYVIAYIVLLITRVNVLTIKETIFVLDMFCSIFNCVSMILFFNRLVQILYFYQYSLRKKLLDKFYFFIATILFPIYACFQVFFAFFDQINPENTISYEIVKGTVFFVCFLGKLFLILFLFTFIKIKWLHSAIMTLLAYEETPITIAQDVSAISNSIDLFEDDIKDLKEE